LVTRRFPPIHIIFNNSLFAYYILTMFTQPSFVQKYIYSKKTNYDLPGKNNEKMVGGMPINQSAYYSTALNNNNNNTNSANLVGLDKYALPAGLVLSTTLFSEHQAGGGKINYSESIELDQKMIRGGDRLKSGTLSKEFGAELLRLSPTEFSRSPAPCFASAPARSSIIGDEMFDKLFGMAAHSIAKPRNNTTHKILARVQSKSYTKSKK
jgi:hypothetical protein